MERKGRRNGEKGCGRKGSRVKEGGVGVGDSIIYTEISKIVDKL